MVELRDSKDDSSETPDTPVSNRVWLRSLVWGVVNLAGGCLICLAVLAWQNDPELPDQQPAITRPVVQLTPPPALPTSEVPRDEVLQRADDLLLSGDPAGALIHYERILTESETDNTSLLYRRAICMELTGRDQLALETYQRIVDRAESPAYTAAAQLGVARIWYQTDKLLPAETLLYQILLQSSENNAAAAAAWHTLAHFRAARLMPKKADLLEEQAIIAAELPRKPAFLLGLSEVDGLAAAEADVSMAASTKRVEVLDQFIDDPASIHLAVRVKKMRLADLLAEVREKANLQFDIESEAREVLRVRTVNIAVDDVDLATLLDAILEPATLSWSRQQGKVVVSGRRFAEAVSAEQLSQKAQRLCRSALAFHPESQLVPSTQLVLGNLYFLSNRLVDAEGAYRDLIRQDAEHQIVRAAWFNLAKLYFRQDDLQATRRALFKVVDHARGTFLEPLAYLHLGCLFLEDGQNDDAIRQLARALSLAEQASVRQTSTITLACAYLITGNPQAANATLMDHRDALKGSPGEANGAFLAALARFRSSANSTQKVRRGRDVTNSLAYAEPERFFCFAGRLLVGLAYDEIGLPNQMQAVFESAIEQAHHHELRRRMQLRLAQRYVEQDRLEDGKRILRELSEASDSDLARVARIQLAQLALQQDELNDCLQICYAMITQSTSTQEQADLLRIMGRVYQRQQDHYKAAICFAGMIPTMEEDMR